MLPPKSATSVVGGNWKVTILGGARSCKYSGRFHCSQLWGSPLSEKPWRRVDCREEFAGYKGVLTTLDVCLTCLKGEEWCIGVGEVGHVAPDQPPPWQERKEPEHPARVREDPHPPRWKNPLSSEGIWDWLAEPDRDIMVALPAVINLLWTRDGERWEALEQKHHPASLPDIAAMVLNYLAAYMGGAPLLFPAPEGEEPSLPSPVLEGEESSLPSPAPEGEEPLLPSPAPEGEEPLLPSPAPEGEEPLLSSPAPEGEEPLLPSPTPEGEKPLLPSPALEGEEPSSPPPPPSEGKEQELPLHPPRRTGPLSS
ncbi:UNVERIFIED_CONTAM: hypothetical protein FKN15_062065 [Acipenser sinensis]